MQLSKSLPTKMVTGALTILMLAITSEPSTPQELTKVNVSIIPIIDAAPLFAARTFGYFKEVGLEIDVKPTIGGAQGLTALAAGDVDVVLSNIVSTTLAVHQGLKISCHCSNNFDWSRAAGPWWRGGSGRFTNQERVGTRRQTHGRQCS